MPKFLIKYDRHMSTIGQEIDVTRETEMEFDKRPTRKDFPRIESVLEDEFLRRHRKNLKRVMDISYKVRRVVPV